MSVPKVKYDKNALRELVAAVLRESNENAVVILRKFQGATLQDAAYTLAEIGNGKRFASEADRLADIRAAHDFARGVLDKFRPFADIIAEVLPRGAWVHAVAHGNGARNCKIAGIADGRKMLARSACGRVDV